MNLVDIFQVLVLSAIQVLPDIIDILIQVTNSVTTINEMNIHIFILPPFKSTTSTYPEHTTTSTTYIEPTTTTIELGKCMTSMQMNYIVNSYNCRHTHK